MKFLIALSLLIHSFALGGYESRETTDTIETQIVSKWLIKRMEENKSKTEILDPDMLIGYWRLSIRKSKDYDYDGFLQVEKLNEKISCWAESNEIPHNKSMLGCRGYISGPVSILNVKSKNNPNLKQYFAVYDTTCDDLDPIGRVNKRLYIKFIDKDTIFTEEIDVNNFRIRGSIEQFTTGIFVRDKTIMKKIDEKLKSQQKMLIGSWATKDQNNKTISRLSFEKNIDETISWKMHLQYKDENANKTITKEKSGNISHSVNPYPYNAKEPHICFHLQSTDKIVFINNNTFKFAGHNADEWFEFIYKRVK